MSQLPIHVQAWEFRKNLSIIIEHDIGTFGTEDAKWTGPELARAIIRADLVVWEDSYALAAANGFKAFEGTIPDATVSGFGQFHCFIPGNIDIPRLKNYSRLLGFWVVQSGEDGLLFYYFLSKKEPVYPYIKVLLGMVSYSSPFDFNNNRFNSDFDSQIYALLAFMKMPVICSEQAHLPRNLRRQLKRSGESEPFIRIVRLRKSESIGHQDIYKEWHWQWMVSGHWRKQWYPSTQTHKPLYITSYIKGPDGKPLKPLKQTIFVVNR